ncbi:hypothetical protein DFH09DRAFT_1355678 [Mycena vulgaris]|nr:hypothetical protein DFH09DRAFT_1355678 [Mycena vulgaris]
MSASHQPTRTQPMVAGGYVAGTQLMDTNEKRGEIDGRKAEIDAAAVDAMTNKAKKQTIWLSIAACFSCMTACVTILSACK